MVDQTNIPLHITFIASVQLDYSNQSLLHMHISFNYD